MNKLIGSVVVLTISLITFVMSCETSYLSQSEIGFAYNAADGRPVNQQNNPLLSAGFHITWGYNAKFFVVDGGVGSYNFTAKKDKDSPYDESLTWDSDEGATMQGEFTILGQVVDPWKFYPTYGTTQRSYSLPDGVKDVRVYEALRHAGQFVSVKMNESAGLNSADFTLKNPGQYAKWLTKLTDAHMRQFGFGIIDVMFPNRFDFPGGGSIKSARARLQNASSEFEKRLKQVEISEKQKTSVIATANIEANKIRAEGDREADQLKSEASALAKQLSAAIHRVGVDGAMQLKMAELQGDLIKTGVIPQAVLGQDSIFGQPFYSLKKGEKIKTPLRALKGGKAAEE